MKTGRLSDGSSVPKANYKAECHQQKQAGQHFENRLTGEDGFAHFEKLEQKTTDPDQRAADTD